MSKFTHLHVHSHYSLLDGLPKIPDLVAFAKQQGLTSLALTDHGVMYGTVEFYKTAVAAGLKPIIGVEAYVAPRKLTDKQTKLDDSSSHLVLLARNLEGYQNLLKLVSLAHVQGFYYKPRIDHEALQKYHGGLVALSACLKGEIPQALARGDDEAVRDLIDFYRQTFGEENFFLEVQAHPELAPQVELNQRLRALSQELSLPLIATNDSHYLLPSDQEVQDILVCIQTGKKVTDEKRLDMRGVNTSLKSEATMHQDLPDFADAIDMAGTLAAELNCEIPLNERHFPSYPTPSGETPEAYLRLQAEQGLISHYTQEVSEEVRKRLEYELGIIMKKGFASYFLVVADFVNWARANGIIATTRGSAAGSLVSYLIGVTTVNPLTYHLPFERFLNDFRPTPPDIDMDFADNRRDDVIAYVTAKYGVDQVAQIVTFGTMAARAAVRDVGRALGYPYSLCDQVAKLIPIGSQGFHMTIERAVNETSELKALAESDHQVGKLLELAKRLEGCARHASVHAAGVVIAPTPLTDYLPLQYDSDGKNIITQYDMWACEDVGLVKMDFLGIRNLSIMGSAVTIIKKTKQIDIDLQNIPLNDSKTFALVAKGETMGMFQLGGSGMTRYLKELKPGSITDIMAMVALFRPGPMNSIPDFIKRKHNPKLITYLDPRLKNILKDSYGIITYQDDVLLIAIELAGYTWEEADKLRKAMGKKIVKEMARQKEKFISGCVTRALTEDKARKLWELIEPFAAYGFNKAHAASYGIVAYQTAYLKANFPTEFMAALMTAEAGDLDTIAQAVGECGRMGITVLPPDVNESLATFTVVDDTRIRFGLTAIKNLGEQVVEAIIAERKARGPFASLADFLHRVAGREINKKSLESLIKSGAVDSFQFERGQLLAHIETLLNVARSAAQAKNSQQSSLFSNDGAGVPSLTLPEAPPATKAERLAWERELLGLYITEHPFTDFRNAMRGKVAEVSELEQLTGEPTVTIAGLITTVKPITTKKGDAMAFITLEDMSAATEVVIFPDSFRQYRAELIPDTVIAIRGRLSEKNGERKLIAQSIVSLTSPEQAAHLISEWHGTASPTNQPKTPEPKPISGDKLVVTLSPTAAPEAITQLKALLERSLGTTPVTLILSQGGIQKQIATPYRVNVTPSFEQACRDIIGQGKFYYSP